MSTYDPLAPRRPLADLLFPGMFNNPTEEEDPIERRMRLYSERYGARIPGRFASNAHTTEPPARPGGAPRPHSLAPIRVTQRGHAIPNPPSPAQTLGEKFSDDPIRGGIHKASRGVARRAIQSAAGLGAPVPESFQQYLRETAPLDEPSAAEVPTYAAATLAAEVLKFVGPGRLVGAAALSPIVTRAAQAGGAAGTVAKGLQTAAAPTTAGGRLLRNVATGSPVDIFEAAAGAENTGALALAEAVPGLQGAAPFIRENPTLGEVLFGLGAGELLEEGPRIARSAAPALRRVMNDESGALALMPDAPPRVEELARAEVELQNRFGDLQRVARRKPRTVERAARTIERGGDPQKAAERLAPRDASPEVVAQLTQAAEGYKQAHRRWLNLATPPEAPRRASQPGAGQPERVVAAAFRNRQDGRLLYGGTHTDVLFAAEAKGLLPPGKEPEEVFFNEWEDGFFTDRGRFVDRDEAMELARTARQRPQTFVRMKDGSTPLASEAVRLDAQRLREGLQRVRKAGGVTFEAGFRPYRGGGKIASLSSRNIPPEQFAADDWLDIPMTLHEVMDFANENAQILARYPQLRLGVSRLDDGTWSIDLNAIFRDQEEAKDLARRTDQESVFDADLGELIPVGGSGKTAKGKLSPEEVGKLLSAYRSLGFTRPEVMAALARAVIGATASGATIEEGDSPGERAAKIAGGGIVGLLGLQGLATLRKGNLLAAPSSVLKSGLSNSLEAAMQQADQPVAAGVDYLVGRFLTGERTKSFAPVAQMAASRRAVRGVAKDMARIARGKEPNASALARGMEQIGRTVQAETAEKFDLQYGAAHPIVRAWTDLVMRSQSLADWPFRSFAFQRSIEEQARVIARSGRPVQYQGRTIKPKPGRQLDWRQLAENPTDEMVLIALTDAEEAVFQRGSVLGDAVAGMKASLQKRGQESGAEGFVARQAGATMDLAIPYSRTLGSVTGRLVERTPFGTLSSAADLIRLWGAARGADRATVRELQKKFSERTARWTTGTLAIAIGAELARQGLMSGPASERRSQRNTESMVLGQQPNAVLIDGRWYRVDGLSPQGNLLAVGAAFGSAYEDQGVTAGFGAGTGEIGRTVAAQPLFEGTREVADLLQGETDWRREAGDVVGGALVPSAVGRVARTLDPVVRDPRGDMLGPVKERIPGARESLPARVGPLGEEVRQDGPALRRAWENVFSPVPSREDRTRNDPLAAELARLEVAVPMLGRRQEESAEEYSQRQQLYGEILRAELEEEIRGGEYAGLLAALQEVVSSDPSLRGADPYDLAREDLQRAIERRIRRTRSIWSRIEGGRQ